MDPVRYATIVNNYDSIRKTAAFDPAQRLTADNADVGELLGYIDDLRKEKDMRAALMDRIGALRRGDWSGASFDGRTGRDWLAVAAHGDGAALKNLADDLTGWESEYD